jgi:hypothetical protein
VELMAGDRSIIRRIVSVFDRKSADKAQDEMVRSLSKAGEEGGKKAGQNFLRDLRAEFNKRKAELAEQLARGTIDQKEFKKQADLAAKTFNAGLLKGIEEARRQGKLTDAEYVKLTRSIKRVGDEGRRSLGQVNTSMERLRAIALKVTAVLASLWVVRRVVEFGKAVFDLGSQVLAVGNQFNTVFGGELSDLLRDRTEELRLMAGLTRRQSEEILAGAGSMAQGFGMAKDASADFGAQILQLSADLASFNNVPTAEAAKLVQSALIGNTEAARSLKVSFTALDVTNRALAMTGKATAKELTQEEKALAALAVMTERAGPMIGDLNRTQHDADNVAKQLAASYQQVKESLAAVIIQGAAGELGLTMLRDLFRDLDDWVVRNAESISAWATGTVKSVGYVVDGFLALWRAVKGVAEIFTGVLFGVLAAGAHGLSLLAEAAGLASRAKARFLGLFSAERAAAADRESEAILANARALREWARAAEEVGREALRTGLFPGTGGRPAAGPGPSGEAPGSPPAAPGAPGGESAGPASEPEIAATRELLDLWRQYPGVMLHITQAERQAKEEAERMTEAWDRLNSTMEVSPKNARVLADAAADMESAWVGALDAVEAEARAVSSTIEGLFFALAVGGIEGLARLAKAKVAENLARAAENFAKAWGWIGSLNPAGAAASKKAAVGHLGAAAKWGAVAGVAGAVGGGGRAGGGGSLSGAVPSMTQAGRTEPPAPRSTSISTARASTPSTRPCNG